MTIEPQDLEDHLGQTVTIKSRIWGEHTGELTEIMRNDSGGLRGIMLDQFLYVPTEQSTITEGVAQ